MFTTKRFYQCRTGSFCIISIVLHTDTGAINANKTDSSSGRTIINTTRLPPCWIPTLYLARRRRRAPDTQPPRAIITVYAYNIKNCTDENCTKVIILSINKLKQTNQKHKCEKTTQLRLYFKWNNKQIHSYLTETKKFLICKKRKKVEQLK